MLKHLAIILLFASAAVADIVHFNDGTTAEGKIYRNGSNWTLITPDGQSRTIAASDVSSIELGNSGSNLLDQLASLRRSLDLSANPEQAVARLQAFIQHNAGSPAAEDAKKDLVLWQDRLDKHLSKIGGDWMTPEQANQLRQQTVFIADHARQLMRQGKIYEAAQLINQIIDVDPNNAAAFYLRGLVDCDNNQPLTAEKDFAVVATVVPRHGPTLNNLAVLSFHVGHFGTAAQQYGMALQCDPMDRRVIDNVAEMLHDFPSNLNLPELRALQAEFAQQEAALEHLMAKQNLNRWGSKWVTNEQMQQIQAAQKLVHDKLTELATDQTKAQAEITAVDQQITEDEKSQQQIANTSYVVDPTTGRMAYTTYPPAYYDLGRDIVDLKTRRQTAMTKLDQIAAEARVTQAQLPIQPYTGVQQIIGEEGTPINATKATSEPTSQSTTPTGGGNALPL